MRFVIVNEGFVNLGDNFIVVFKALILSSDEVAEYEILWRYFWDVIAESLFDSLNHHFLEPFVISRIDKTVSEDP